MKHFTSILCVAMLAASLIGCGGSAGKSAAVIGDDKLTVWLSTAMVSDSDQKKTNDQWVISQIAREFEAENLGCTVELVLNPDQIAMMQMFKAAAATNDCPDIVNVWAGQQLFGMTDIILDIKDTIPAEDKAQILGWDTATLDFKDGGPVLGYPASGNEVCGLLYNKQVLAQCGLDYDSNPAKTIEQFMQDLHVIKEKGFLPMAGGDCGWNESFYVVYASWWVQASGSAMVSSNSVGQTKFADDAGFIKAVKTGLDIYQEGLINTDFASIPNSCQRFQEGDVGFLTTGNWNASVAAEALGEENVGFINPPNISADAPAQDVCIGGPGQTLVISKTCKNPELALKFLSFLSGKENMIKINKNQSKLPLRRDIALDDLGIASTGLFRQIADAAQNYVFWADNSMVPNVNDELQKLGPLALTGKMSIEELTSSLDQKAAEISR